jgi:CPA1 family monovalent cation:H+ antiporter
VIHHVEVQVLILLAIAAVVGMGARRLRLPYTLALVVTGLVLGFVHIDALAGLALSPDLLLLLLLPPLLFEASLHLHLTDLRRDLAPILLMAGPGVVVSMGFAATILYFGAGRSGLATGIGWPQALMFGAALAATDPISVLALFRELGVPRRMYLLVEGESLLNDGVAVVIFVILGKVFAIAGGEPLVGAAIASEAIKTFVWMVGVGVATGLAIGVAASVLMRQIDDHLIEIVLTLVVAYSAFLAAETMHASGVLATVAAGVTVGSFGSSYGMSVSTRVAVEDFWEVMAFLANSFVFLLVGLELEPGLMWTYAGTLGVAFAGIVVARMASIYSLLPILNRLAQPVPASWAPVLVWGGLRGSLSMVLVLTLPATFPGRGLLVTLVFGVVGLSLLVQGLSIPVLLARLGLGGGDPDERAAYERSRGRALAATEALHHLHNLERDVLAEGLVRDRVDRWYRMRRDAALAEARAHAGDTTRDELTAETLGRLADAEREAVREALRTGTVGPGAGAALLREIDLRAHELQELSSLPEEERRAALRALLGEE